MKRMTFTIDKDTEKKLISQCRGNKSAYVRELIHRDSPKKKAVKND